MVAAFQKNPLACAKHPSPPLNNTYLIERSGDVVGRSSIVMSWEDLLLGAGDSSGLPQWFHRRGCVCALQAASFQSGYDKRDARRLVFDGCFKCLIVCGRCRARILRSPKQETSPTIPIITTRTLGTPRTIDVLLLFLLSSVLLLSLYDMETFSYVSPTRWRDAHLREVIHFYKHGINGL